MMEMLREVWKYIFWTREEEEQAILCLISSSKLGSFQLLGR